MIFHELYSAYYTAVANILSALIDGNTDEKALNSLVCEHAFGESLLTVLPALKSEKWQLMHGDFSTPICHKPTMPLTTLQKRWLKAISLDPRVRLFGIDFGDLSDVEPLFTAEDVRVYDRYADGDPFEDKTYIAHFRTILQAMRSGQDLRVEMTNRRGKTMYVRCVPERLEYSEKDDKFRLVTSGCHFVRSVNLARITKCRLYNGEYVIASRPVETQYDTLVLRVSEERNTLERCLMHFAHFEKRAERVDGEYHLTVRYDRDDAPEMVIRVLQFGPTVEVLGPDRFKNLIIDKLKNQKSCGLL